VVDKLIEDLKLKNFKSISKIISHIENSTLESEKILEKIFPLVKNSYRIGITGPPGAGKSTITNLLIKHFRKLNKSIGVLLVDPTSPFTGGSVLGDRIRMNTHYEDDNVFVRSVATRGSKGGLALNISNMADVLDAAGFDIILFETVGVGQIEIDVVEQVDSVVLVLVPESGDDIQILKAGIIEISDIFVINKSDRDGANHLVSSLKNMLDFSNDELKWNPKIIKTIGTKDEGVKELSQILLKHNEFISNNEFKKNKINQRYLNKVNDLVVKDSFNKIWTKSNLDVFENEVKKDFSKRLPPNKLLKKLLR